MAFGRYNDDLDNVVEDLMTERKKPSAMSRFLSFLNKHKWAILVGVLLTAGIVTAAVMFWPVIVASAAVTTAAAAITTVTANMGFAVSATAFAVTTISLVGAAVVTGLSFLFDKLVSGIQKSLKPKQDFYNPGNTDYRQDDMLDPPFQSSVARIAHGASVDLRNNSQNTTPASAAANYSSAKDESSDEDLAPEFKDLLNKHTPKKR